MGAFIDLTGKRFGRLVVLERYNQIYTNDHIHWKCKCDCGKESIHRGMILRQGSCNSCGCLALESRTTHGRSEDQIHDIWHNMHSRCNDSNNSNYGSRGIKVCDRWKSFENFLEDIGELPTNLHSLERINNDKGYSLDNCTWILLSHQGRNKRASKLTEELVKEIKTLHVTGKYSYAELGRQFNIDGSHVRKLVVGLRWKN